MQGEQRRLPQEDGMAGGGNGGVAAGGASGDGGRAKMYSSAPCWSCYLSGEVHPRDGASREFGGCRAEVTLPSNSASQGMVEGVADSGWHATLTRGLHQAWEAGLFTDLVITTQDQIIHAHKVILAAASPYFRAMLTGCLMEGRTHTLELKDVPGSLMTTVLTYVYTGRATLTEHNVQEILTLADYFQIHSLKKLCCYHLKNHLVTRTCLNVHEVATLHRCHDLAADALALASSQCSEVLVQPSFLTLQPDTILTLLKQPYLSVESEEELLKGVILWASKDPDERRKWLPALCQKIDLSMLDSQARVKYISALEDRHLLTEDLKFIIAPLDSSADTAEEGSDDQEDTKKTRYNSQEEVLLVMGGESNGRLLRNTECFAVGYSSWRCSIPEVAGRTYNHTYHRLQVLPVMSHARAYCAVATHDNIVYVLGGQTNSQFLASCESYSVVTNSWRPLCDLPLSIHGAAAAFLDGALYIAGGKSMRQYEENLWVYDVQRDAWVARGSLSSGRGHLGMAALHGSLYAVGGVSCIGGISQVLASCEKYDPGSDMWVPIASLSQGRAYHGVAVINDHLYAIGGYDGSRWLSSVERYDPLRDQWTTVSSMISPRSSFGVTVSRGRIYCLGGFSGESNLNTVEKYNPRTDMWHCVQSMQLRRYGLVAATVNVPGAPNP